jgi:hypothetical protein
VRGFAFLAGGLAISGYDAVVVVPGIMGSELIDVATGRLLWGLRDFRWYLRAWTSGESLKTLQLTDDERAGIFGRIRPGGLLRFPAFAPLLRGFEPYTALSAALRAVTAHPDAVTEFAYDWRLPVAHNAGRLADAIAAHLARWRDHPACLAARRTSTDGAPARVVIVAHSMGGMLARHLRLIPGSADDVRVTLTFGTPFFGAPKAAVLLSSGRGAPLPRERVRRFAVGIPGIYDLLPTYRCVDTGVEARCLDASDISALGADPELWKASATWHAELRPSTLAGHVRVVGTHQPTVQALTIRDGIATGHRYTCTPAANGVIARVDQAGDGTVPRVSGTLPGSVAQPLAQTHGALARTAEAVVIASDVVADRDTGPWQGGGQLGLEIEDVLEAGVATTLLITGASHPRHVRCQVTNVSTGRQAAIVTLRPRDDHLAGEIPPLAPGLYRVQAAGGGTTPVTQLVMVYAT